MVNTCGFVEAAKKDSVDTLLAAADLKDDRQRPARWSPSAAWPSGTAPSWPSRCPRPTPCSASTTTRPIAERLRPHPGRRAAHRPRARATGAPCCRSSPVDRAAGPRRRVPGHAVPGSGQRQPGPRAGLELGPTCRPVSPRPAGRAPFRRRLDHGPSAPLKIASGCDRRCTFCAIPAFRGAYVSRPPADVVAEARWLAERGRPRGRSWSVRTPPPTARTSATSGCWRSCSAELSGVERAGLDPGVLPAAGRDASRSGRGDGLDPEGGALLRPLLPARRAERCCAGCAGSATPTRSWPDRLDPRAGPDAPGSAAT